MFKGPDGSLHGQRVYHFASKIRGDGAASALCFPKPRAINRKVASWTNRREAVTCKKCLRALADCDKVRDSGQ